MTTTADGPRRLELSRRGTACTLAWALFGLTACDGNAGTSQGLQGTWAYDDGEGCLSVLTFAGRRYETSLLCTPEAGGPGLQTERGTFTTTSHLLVFAAELASCEDIAPTESLGFSLEGARLTLSDGDGAPLATWRRAVLPAGGIAVAPFGCYDATGFTARPLGPLLGMNDR